MPKADSKNGDFAIEMFDRICRDSVIFDGFAWSGGDDEMTRVEGSQFVECDLVIAEDANIRAKFTKVLDEVIGKGVVVID